MTPPTQRMIRIPRESRSDCCSSGAGTNDTPNRNNIQRVSINDYSQSSSLSSSALRPSRGLLGALLGTPDAAPTMS